MTVHRAAVIGLGRMGSTFDDEIPAGGSLFMPYCHGPTYYHSPRVELVAGADLHDEQRALFGERWEVPSEHLYGDYEEMLAKENLDIVSVCVTARHRSAIVQNVARAGVKGIWAEKPITLSLQDADDMVRVCREAGVALAINCARRWNPFYTEARNIIDSGELGDVLQVTSQFRSGMGNFASHLTDTIRYLAGGNVEWVFGEMESDEAAASDDDILGNGYLAFDNGARAFMRGMSCGDVSGWDIEVICDKGRIRCRENPPQFEITRPGAPAPYGRGFRSSERMEVALPATYPIPMPPRMQGMGLTIVDDLISAFENGHAPKCSGEDGLAALEVAVGLRESHRRGGAKVSLPVEDRSLSILFNDAINDHIPRRIRRLQEIDHLS